MTGKFTHGMDDKGRLFVPAKLRDDLGEVFYVAPGLDGCLTAYTEPDWNRIMERYNALPLSKQNASRYFFANSAKCEPDKQGRFLLPAELRAYAGLGGDVTFIGVAGHAEIWDSATYAALEQENLTPEKLQAAMEALGF